MNASNIIQTLGRELANLRDRFGVKSIGLLGRNKLPYFERGIRSILDGLEES